ncbi:hypothetical protein [Bacillus sp. NPDC094106]|uniref:hypothetical protein n=1 Tax=Bacillus sp. NPDC094106 TaxID=3363949 RepID=UPI0038011ADB
MVQIKERVCTMGSKEIFEKEGSIHACRLCGRYFDKGEQYYRINSNSLGGYFLVHCHEWNEFVKNCMTEDELSLKLKKKKKPRTSNATQPNVELADKMRSILEERNLHIVSETRNKITFRIHKRKRTLGTFVYDKRYIRIESKSDSMNGMLSRRLFIQSLMNELFGTNEDFLQEVNEEVKKIFG